MIGTWALALFQALELSAMDVRVAAPAGDAPCTAAIQHAIDACHAQGGGRAVLPAGTYVSGTIFLKDRVELHLAAGAVLRGSGSADDFPLQHPAYRSYHDRNGYAALIYAEKASDIAITGEGTIDGNNGVWRRHAAVKGGGDDDGRPRNILFASCRNIRVARVTLLNAVMWNQHYLDCEDGLIEGVTVSSFGRPNNDGIDLDGCRRFVVRDCDMDSDDDCLTLKSTGLAPCDDIAVSNCTFRSHCNAIKTGTESSGGFRNIRISHCDVKITRDRTSSTGAPTGITGITIGCVDGGVCEHIRISDIRIEGTGAAIFLRLGKRNRPHVAGAAVTQDSTMRDIVLSNITAAGAGNLGCYVLGLPGNPIRDLVMANVSIESAGGFAETNAPADLPENPRAYPQPTSWGAAPAYGFFIRHAAGVALHDIDLSLATPDARPALWLSDVSGIDLRNVEADRSGDRPLIVRQAVADETGSGVTPRRPLTPDARNRTPEGSSRR